MRTEKALPAPGRKVESWGKEKSKVKGDKSKRRNSAVFLISSEINVCFCQSIAIHSGLEFNKKKISN